MWHGHYHDFHYHIHLATYNKNNNLITNINHIFIIMHTSVAVNHESIHQEQNLLILIISLFYTGDITLEILTYITIKHRELPERGRPLPAGASPFAREDPPDEAAAGDERATRRLLPSTTEGKTEGREERGKGDVQILVPLPLSCIQI